MRLADKSQVATAFGRAAHSYDTAATVQKTVADALMAQLTAQVPLDQACVLDAGCGTGYISHALKNRGAAHVTALDLSDAMLTQAMLKASAHDYVQGDIESLPLPSDAFDAVISSLAVQWCHDLPRALSELVRVLKPGGRLYVATLADPTLHELKKAWQAVDDAQHVVDFLPVANIESAAEGLGRTVRCHHYCEVLTFSGIFPLLKSLQGIGATAIDRTHKGLMGKAQLQTLARAYPQHATGLPLSYYVTEIVIIK
ncbi:malonyl-ACP O-methyltransferase BioC [Wohlfahrtiimonas chitiniclastica]|uniref:malonyl-ACP O-methyltransferase BioC n=1 Tax=Wohlfahrtiimonas chitiniclastica TaxID=400946 RepID=UPI001BCCE042|nr:malonyl-ACP O-methyltransferase BioC [Wohlfahrtiimonas chitiniclastica]MBS7813868.1 malonyl-ACP O-methyltransferase BioC [Wohlfahrtiimonas chitiniclastica]MBS7819924.1 malonyl-ACP O-methyltransferase BioC [Wohlfahrtiimonas chitiniclastica]MBS7825731.1 malonyl-ACP O-methyltransferase BioC [Wohlfahrtiimonas chitiniclastica]